MPDNRDRAVAELSFHREIPELLDSQIAMTAVYFARLREQRQRLQQEQPFVPIVHITLIKKTGQA